MPLPPAPILLAIAQAEAINLETEALYRKGSWLNSYRILTPQGGLALTVPVRHPVWGKPWGAVEIDYAQPWQRRHLRAVEAAYRKAPYFEQYWPGYQNLIVTQHASLCAMVERGLTFCLTSIGKRAITTINIHESCKIGPEKVTNRSHYDIITQAKAAPPQWPAGLAYSTVFGTVFDETTSVLDALFCAGPLPLAQALLASSLQPSVAKL